MRAAVLLLFALGACVSPRRGPPVARPPTYAAAPGPVAVVDSPPATATAFDPATVPAEGEIQRSAVGAATVIDVVLVADGVPIRFEGRSDTPGLVTGAFVGSVAPGCAGHALVRSGPGAVRAPAETSGIADDPRLGPATPAMRVATGSFRTAVAYVEGGETELELCGARRIRFSPVQVLTLRMFADEVAAAQMSPP
jgi:hypothetical protein